MSRPRASGPALVQEIAERLRDLMKEIVLMMVEQHLELTPDLVHYAYVLDQGRITLECRASELRRDASMPNISSQRPCGVRTALMSVSSQ